jgi:hypothetical protein
MQPNRSDLNSQDPLDSENTPLINSDMSRAELLKVSVQLFSPFLYYIMFLRLPGSTKSTKTLPTVK